MRRVFATGVMVVAVLWTLPASAQSAAGSGVPAGPIINSWYLGANGGAAVVEKFGAAAGVEGGLRVWKNLDAVGEIAWAANSASRRQLDKVATLARSLSATQGGTATSDIKVPTLYGGLGARWVIEQSGRFRPYFMATVGSAKVNLKPTLTLQGADVTDSAAQYGITLGQDVVGKYNHFATEGGVGVVMGVGTFYVDLGVRLLSINADQRVNVARLALGGGYRF